MKKQLIPSFLDENILSLLDSLNIGFLYEDMDNGILQVNKKILEWYGGSREEIVGHRTSEFLSADDYKRLTALDLDAIQQKKQQYQFELVLSNKKGDQRPFLVSVTLFLDDDGKLISSFSLFTDISEQKQIQDELNLSRKALENEKKMLEVILFGIGDCVTIFDPKGNLLLNNPKGGEIRGNRISPLMTLKEGEKGTFSFNLSGERRQFLGQVEVVHDSQGQVYAYAEILKEISHKIKLEERENELFHIKRTMKLGEIESVMIGISPAIKRVFDLILRCAEVDSTVLILGETGVGKELAARAIHTQSNRRGKPFVAVNCGSLPETLLESELFGHEKGSFTGASTSRLGLFREAHEGTLFLDEVGDLKEPLQVKLLRALQEKEIRPVGGNRSYPIDVRVIAATHRDLKELVKQESFREDLYYRIAVIPIVIPSLRERQEDILLLADHFVRKHCKRNNQAIKTINTDAKQLLITYQWPGNIRELENTIEYAFAMAHGTSLKPADFPIQLIANKQSSQSSHQKIQEDISAPHSYDRKLEDLSNGIQNKDSIARLLLKPWEIEERKNIEDALLKYKGNRATVANNMGISRSTLWRKMKMYHLV
jgi:PAS domain S-box-containing protein